MEERTKYRALAATYLWVSPFVVPPLYGVLSNAFAGSDALGTLAGLAVFGWGLSWVTMLIAYLNNE